MALTTSDLLKIEELLDKKLEEKLDARFGKNNSKLDEMFEIRFTEHDKKWEERLDKRFAEQDRKLEQRLDKRFADQDKRWATVLVEALENQEERMMTRITKMFTKLVPWSEFRRLEEKVDSIVEKMMNLQDIYVELKNDHERLIPLIEKNIVDNTERSKRNQKDIKLLTQELNLSAAG